MNHELTGQPVMTPDLALPGWQQLAAPDREQWWEDLWEQASLLSERYRLALRTGWWQDAVQVELLAALAAWVGLFDSGAWTDPPSKMQLLFELDRIRTMLRAGENVFDPGRDRAGFETHLRDVRCGRV
jgi:hypothetical protein